jgi:hypothetical protein
MVVHIRGMAVHIRGMVVHIRGMVLHVSNLGARRGCVVRPSSGRSTPGKSRGTRCAKSLGELQGRF